MRPRRAGEDPAAIARALELTRRYADLRGRLSSEPGATLADDVEDILGPLATLAVEEFCHWCVIDVVSPRIQRLVATRPAVDAEVTAPPVVVDDLARRARAADSRAREPAEVTQGLPYAVATTLHVHDEAIGTIVFARDPAAPGFGPMELAAVDEVSWAAATSLERSDLRRRRDEAVAEVDLTARRLRQLLEAALALRGTLDATGIGEVVATCGRKLLGAPTRLLVGDAARDAPPGTVWELRSPDGQHRASLWVDRRVAPDVEDGEFAELLGSLVLAALEGDALTTTLAGREARWRALVEHAPMGILEIDPTGAVRWWNRQAARLWGWPLEGPVELPIEARAALEEVWRRAAASTTPQVGDAVGVWFQGRAHDLRVVAQRVTGDAAGDAVLTLVDDVTEWRLVTEELRHAQTMELRGQVAGSIVHDFNNLLTLIVGYADLVRPELSGDARASLEEIALAADRATALAAQLQTIGRVQPAEPRVLRPAAVLGDNASIIGRIVGRSIHVLWRIDDPGPVLIDPDRFEQLVLNLVLNARDAMPEGGELTISLDREPGATVAARHEVDRHLDYAVLRVADTGIGMDEDTRARCFEPLFTTKGLKGNGLGLTAARRLMLDSHGSITVWSTPGAGSTFEVAVPLHRGEVAPANADADADEVAARLVASASVFPPAALAGRVALVVEDDPAQRRLATSILARLGLEVASASTAEEALDLVAHGARVDLLVSDVILGQLGGDELARRLRAQLPGLGIVLMSGTADPSIAAGITDAVFLPKPFRPSALVERVAAVLNGGAPHGESPPAAP